MTQMTQIRDPFHQLRFPKQELKATEAPVKEPPQGPPDKSTPAIPNPTKPAVPVEPMRIIPPLQRPDECPDTGNPHCPVS